VCLSDSCQVFNTIISQTDYTSHKTVDKGNWKQGVSYFLYTAEKCINGPQVEGQTVFQESQ
jgi:hypothetical protein